MVATVMQIESCGHPSIKSRAGADGLFQVMPFHFGSTENPEDPETNALRGLNYLQRTHELAGRDAKLTFAGYNGGQSVIQQDPITWYEETRRYAMWGEGILTDIAHGREQSPTLDRWMQEGGESLCKSARIVLGLQ